MCIKKPITASTEHCCEQIEKLKSAIKTADAILIGAGAGMSSSAGFAYDGERFEKNFSDFRKKNTVSRTCTPAVFIRTIPLRNIGHGGQGIFC